MLHDNLWNLNRDIAQDCLDCEFIRGISDGTLDQEVFKRYVAQDAFFLRCFLKAYALAAAKSESLVHAITFHELMGGVIDELSLHASLSKQLDINIDTLEPYEETLAYTQFLEDTAWKMTLDLITAAMVPCMKLYAWLGKKVKSQTTQNNPYSDWINTYSSQEFQELSEHLEQLLDELANETEEVKNTYRKAMICELNFFKAPLK